MSCLRVASDLRLRKLGNIRKFLNPHLPEYSVKAGALEGSILGLTALLLYIRPPMFENSSGLNHQV